jgi:hypothetical protein
MFAARFIMSDGYASLWLCFGLDSVIIDIF